MGGCIGFVKPGPRLPPSWESGYHLVAEGGPGLDVSERQRVTHERVFRRSGLDVGAVDGGEQLVQATVYGDLA